MTWKTLVIKEFDQLTLQKNNLLVQRSKESVKVKINIDDLNCVLLENNYVLFSSRIINHLIDHKVAIIFTDTKHDPHSIVLPLQGHCLPLKNLSLQLKMTVLFKATIFQKIIQNKISNQIAIMQLTKQEDDVIMRCTKLLATVALDDATNREGIVAKMFFRALYGSAFIRFSDDLVNKILNYGYKILVSCLSRTIVKFGLNLFLGVKHKGPSNPFNLSYDFIEPYRPLIDLWIHEHWNELAFDTNTISYLQRLSLVNLLNCQVLVGRQAMTVNSSFNVLIQSFITALQQQDPTKLKTVKLPDKITLEGWTDENS